MAKSVAKLPPEEIQAFDVELRRSVDRAHTNMLSAAEYVISGASSDDGFLSFVHWLITQGQDAFEGALADPDSIADIDADDVLYGCELLMYVPAEAYERRTGQEFPTRALEFDNDFTGPKATSEAAAAFPRLWKRFRNDDGVPRHWVT